MLFSEYLDSLIAFYMETIMKIRFFSGGGSQSGSDAENQFFLLVLAGGGC